MKIKFYSVVVLGGLFLSACGEQKEEAAAPEKAVQEQAQTMPEGHPPLTAAPQQDMQSQQGVTSGIVKESVTSSGYTYAAVEVDGQVVWIAGPATKLDVGSTVGWKGGSLMSNFTSPSLNRTFDQIYFVSSFVKPQTVSVTSGVVEEVIESAGYIYLKVKTPTSLVWLAAPVSDVKTGETVSWQGGAVMRNFKSNSLDRLFDEVIFVDSVTKG